MGLTALDSCVKGSLVLENINLDVWVEFLKLPETSISSRNLSDMFLFRIKV